MKRSLFVLVVFLGLFALVACGGRDIDTNGGEAAANGANGEVGGVVRIGATAVPHMEILNQVVPILEEQGFEVILVEFDSFQIPNLALVDGDIDINFFQHRPFLFNFNEANDADLIPVFGVHFEPLRLYAGRLDSLENVPHGAAIALPDDPTNEARALQLLESLGLLTLYPGLGLTATATTGIAENPLNLEITTLTAQTLPRILPDVDFAVINGNVALQGGVIDLYIDGAAEDPDSPAAYEFTNFVVVRSGEENDPAVVALVEALNSQEIRDFINNQYRGRVVPTQIAP
jgi:D-methionine transport system substrate-binding protein